MKKQFDLSTIRHSAAHLLAHALTELYPDAQLTLGPATEDGFFYDFLPAQNLKEEDLSPIDARMRELAAKDIPLTHTQITKEEARKLYKDNPFKLELIEGIPGDTVGLAQQGDFYDLCKGGHVPSTGHLKNFKLLGLSGSYWRGDKNNAALQRISGTAFGTTEELAAYEKQREEAAQYDHRKLGKQLDLFSFNEAGPGFPFFHPKGKKVIQLLTNYIRDLQAKYNYQEISTPTLLNADLWKQSGHWDFYKKNMYFSCIDDATYALKPMNCPGAMLIYKSRPRSYRELPLILSEFGHVHRHELSGVLHGLLRVRAFTIDDAHIFATLDQIEEKISMVLSLIVERNKKFDFTNVEYALATRPDNAMGSVEVWDKATTALENALKKVGVAYTVKAKDGAFYGPKIDVYIHDSLGRSWTCGTIQLDFMMPENFDLTYVAASGKQERPVVIHQAIFGSLERFFAIILEHYKGHLPLWLAPIQARILPITDAQRPYAESIYNELKAAGARVEIDKTSDPLAGQIKHAQIEKIPWMIIVGGKEEKNNTVTLRHSDGKQEQGLTLDMLKQRLQAA